MFMKILNVSFIFQISKTCCLFPVLNETNKQTKKTPPTNKWSDPTVCLVSQQSSNLLNYHTKAEWHRVIPSPHWTWHTCNVSIALDKKNRRYCKYSCMHFHTYIHTVAVRSLCTVIMGMHARAILGFQ